jgi:hypothetical protein
MPIAGMRRRPIGLGERAVGAGKTAFNVGRGAYNAGKKVYNVARRMRGSKSGLDPAVDRLVELPMTAEEEIEARRMRRMEKMLEQRLPPEVAEELVELIQRAQQSEISTQEMKEALTRFFRARFREQSELNDVRIKRWVETIMKTTHPEG